MVDVNCWLATDVDISKIHNTVPSVPHNNSTYCGIGRTAR